VEQDENIRSALSASPAGLPSFREDLPWVERRRNTLHRRHLVAGAIALLVGAAAGIATPLTLLSRVGHQPVPVGPVAPPVSVHPFIAARIHVARGSVDLTTGYGAVWVSGFGAVSRIDPATNRVVAMIETPGTEDFSHIAAGAGSVWVTADGGRVYRIDPVHDVLSGTIELGPRRALGEIGIGGGLVWVSDQQTEGQVFRLDPSTNSVTLRGTNRSRGYEVLVGKSVWVDRGDGGFVPMSAAEAFAHVMWFLGSDRFADGGGSLWSIAPSPAQANVVDRLEPSTGRVLSTIPVVRASLLAFGEGYIWVQTQPPSDVPGAYYPDPAHPGTIVLIDTRTNRTVGRPLPDPGLQPISLDFGFGSAWVADYDSGTITRVSLSRP
jgi:hypothetical protein